MMRRLLTLAALVALAAAASAEEVVVIQGGRVIPVVGDPIEEGVVVFRGNQITHVGAKGSYDPATAGADALVVDAKGKVVMPGLVDGYTHLGLIGVGLVKSTRDDDEATAPLTPDIYAADGINVESPQFRITRLHGTTTALVAPSEGNLVPGRSCVIALDGDRVEKMLRRHQAALHASLGEPPMGRFGEKDQAPSTRMGEMALLRKALTAAQEYLAKWKRYQKGEFDHDDPPGPPERDREQEAWAPILKKQAPLIVRAQRLSDIQAAVRLRDEFGIRVVLLRAAEAWKMADDLKAAGIPILYGPVTTQPASHETLGARHDAPALLEKAGVEFALISAGAHNARNLPYQAGIAMSYGLSEKAALEAITIRPARILGIGKQVGSLETGKQADVIVLDGPVYQPRSKVERMWIRGREVELTSRQTELADKHR